MEKGSENGDEIFRLSGHWFSPSTPKKGANAPVWMLLTDMAKKVHPIAKISRVSGLHGEVRLQPLSRYFDEYIETRGLQIGFDPEMVQEIKLTKTIGEGKKRRFKFEGFISRDEAETLIGQTLFAKS